MDKKIYLALAVIAVVALLFFWFRIKKQKKEKMDKYLVKQEYVPGAAGL